MLTSNECLNKIGDPNKQKLMVVWSVPGQLRFGVIPKKIYCSKYLIDPLTQAFKNVIQNGLQQELKTWDGCFNIRTKRGTASMSLHSWGLAIDINAHENQFGKVPTISKQLVKCFTDAGFDWGGEWSKPDGMHFQLKSLP